MKRLTKKQKKKIEFFILAGTAILSLFLWNTFLLYPFKIFVVIIHESSHALAALLSGGGVKELEILWNLGGVTKTSGGNHFIITVAGYTGSLLFGTILFVTSYKRKYLLWFSSISAILLLLMITNFMTEAAGIIFGLIFVVILIFLPRYFDENITNIFFRVIALLNIEYAIYDVISDLFSSSFIQNDADVLAELTGVSATFWALLWFVLSCIIVGFILKYSYKKAF